MASFSDITAVLTAFLLAVTRYTTNGIPIPDVTLTSWSFSDMAQRTGILSQESQRVVIYLSDYFSPISDAGSCFQNSSIEDMKQSLGTISHCNETEIQSTTSHVLAKMANILESLVQRSDIYSDQVDMLQHDTQGQSLTEGTRSAYTAITGNQTVPDITFGMICQGSESLSELLSILKEFKSLFDSMNTIFSRQE